MNVLIYSGDGASLDSVRQTKECLLTYLSPYYAISTISKEQLLEDPWMPFTSLLVMPGGADLPYCNALNGAGNRKIKQFIRKGGKFLGICAGAYYATASIEFEKDTSLEVSGPRELALYDGVAKGAVFKGFQYGSDIGARAAILQTKLGEGETAAFFNGGCALEGDSGAEILARYADTIEIESTDPNPAAIIYKQIGEGKVILSGVHFEYELDEKAFHSRDISAKAITKLYETRQSRRALVRELLGEKLGLNICSLDHQSVPRCTALHLSSLADTQPSVQQFVANVTEVVDSSLLTDSNDTFEIVKPFSSVNYEPDDKKTPIIVYAQDGQMPSPQQTPFFNHSVYFSELKSLIDASKHRERSQLGALLLYGEVLSSTSTILERNPKFLRRVPNGLVVFGTQQVAGRGRGSNVWVNPIGVMAVSGAIRIPQSQCHQPLVFIQYLCSLAVWEAVHSFLTPGKDIGLRLKWPNDVYFKLDDSSLAKVGGVIVSCHVFNGEYVIVFGSGTNVDNANPTISINSRIADLEAGPQISIEALLAKFLHIFDEMVQNFFVSGFGMYEKQYRTAWLHTDSKVTLERYGNVEATIKGVSADTGMLLAEDSSGIKYELQPDGNSFDMMRGLIRRKT